MRYVKLGNTGLEASIIGFGGIPIVRISEEEASKVLKKAMDMGINYFDTARGYGNGDSERKIGKAIKGKRDNVILASKSPKRTKNEMADEINNSLRDFDVDYIDLYQCHIVNDNETLDQILSPDGAFQALKDAKEAGNIGHIGITTHSAGAGVEQIKCGKFETIMLPFNFLETESEKEAIPLAQKRDMAIINMKPFGGGTFYNATVCLKYVLSKGSTITIPGMMTLEEVQENASVGDMPVQFTPEEELMLKEQAKEIGTQFCRRCDYCQPCPEEVPVSKILHSHTMVKRMGIHWLTRENLDNLKAQADKCTECETCVPKCPYDLPIPSLLKERIKYLESEYTKLYETQGKSSN